jgi:hypothetical protein
MVTMNPRVNDVLRSISDSSGRSMSSLVGELLEASLPTFERMAVTFQKLKHVQDLERSKVVEALDLAQSALEPIAVAAMGQFDLFLANVEGAAAASDAGDAGGALRARADGVAGADAPATNRGATPSRGKAVKAGRTGVSKVSHAKGFLKKSGD